MRQKEFIENIYGHLERTEHKVNCLFIPQSAKNNSEVNNSTDKVVFAIQQEAPKTSKRHFNGARILLSRNTETIIENRKKIKSLLRAILHKNIKSGIYNQTEKKLDNKAKAIKRKPTPTDKYKK